MKKILMVCLGNICRSPLAEGILQNKVNELGLNVKVDSAGTISAHQGDLPDIRSIETARNHSLDITHQRSRPFSVNDFDEFDVIYAMDTSNYADLLAKARNEEHVAKVKLILNETYPGENRSVPDPYYGGEDGFEKVYQLLDDACEVIVQKLK